MKRTLRLFVGLAAVVALAGCINVDDFGEYWDKGTVDVKLEGTWQPTSTGDDNDNEPVTFVKKTDHYIMRDEDEQEDPEKYRTLAIGSHAFLMVLGEKDNGGGLVRYKIEGDTLTFWTYKKELLQKAIEDSQVAGTIEHDSLLGDVPHLTKLDDGTLKFLEKAAADENNWEMIGTYKKQPVSNNQAYLNLKSQHDG